MVVDVKLQPKWSAPDSAPQYDDNIRKFRGPFSCTYTVAKTLLSREVLAQDMVTYAPPTKVPETGRLALLAIVHNAIHGHNGIYRMCGDLRSQGKQWRKIAKDTAEFVKSCDLCEIDRLQSGELQVNWTDLGPTKFSRNLRLISLDHSQQTSSPTRTY